MVVTPSETVIFFKKETEKECFPIVVTVSGMVISATLLSAKRAGGISARSSEKYTLSVQGAKRLCHVILPIFGVILSRRTSSTPLSSALKMGKIPMAEVGESEGAKFAVL